MKKPKDITELSVSFRKLLPPKSFYCMMMFGTMFINERNKDKYEARELNGLNKPLKNHEMIHVKQAITKHNSWVLYYLCYIWMWLKNLPFINGFDMPYKFIPFEMEAYYYEDDFEYCMNHSDGTNFYEQFNNLTLKEKKNLYNEYKEMKKTQFIAFKKFLHLKFDF